MAGTTYDTGALIAADRDDRRMWLNHRWLIDHQIVPTVPAPVLAEAWRGGPRQARLSRLLASCVVEPLTEGQARAIGVLCGRADHHDIADVAVVEGAARRGDSIVTSDVNELRRIADAAGVALDLEPV